MTIENAFVTPQEFDVDVHDTESRLIGAGRLVVGGGHGAQVAIRWTTFTGALADGATCPRLVASTVDGKQFTLFGCQYQSYRLFADVVVEGAVDDGFVELSVRFSNFTEWFLAGQRVAGEAGESLTWEGRPDAVSADIDTGQEVLHVSTTVESAMSRAGDDTVISEQVWMSVAKEGPFDIEEARVRCRDLSIFLSLLLAQPIDVLGLVVKDASGKQHHAWFQYFEPGTETSGIRGWARFLAQGHHIEGQWKTLLENFYRSAYREVAWTRVAGMFRYDSFWDFRFFGYVSLLDGVVSLKARGHVTEITKPSRDRMVKLKSGLLRMDDPLNAGQLNRVLDAVRHTFAREDRSFGACFRYATSTSHQGVVRVINITKLDFRFIKKVRNALAHGNSMNLDAEEYNRLPRLIHKVGLLLTYWAWADFGLTAENFLDSLFQTQNPLAMGADVDRVALDRALKRAAFHPVTEEAFRTLPAKNGVLTYACFTKTADGLLQYSPPYSALIPALMRAAKVAPTDLAEAIGVVPERVVMLGPAYLEFGEETVELVWSYVVDASTVE